MTARLWALCVTWALFLAASPAWAALPPGCVEWADNPNFVHPPLACMEPYKRFVEYPISAWCFHGMEDDKSPYAEKFVRDFKAIGFNVLIDDERILPFAEKVGGVKVQLCGARSSAKSKATFYQPAEVLDANFFKNPAIGDHPMLQGIIVGDNGGGFDPREVNTAEWLKKEHPHVVPIMSLYSYSPQQGNTPLRILHMQSYPYMPGRRGYSTGRAARRYCEQLERDRQFCNANDMALFECYAGDTTFTCVRFQMMCAMAYGAQGISNFCYSPHRMPAYKPDNPLVPQWYKLHRYTIDVLGRHLWGTRSIEVLGGEHASAKTFGPDQLVVAASENLMAGLLTPEVRFKAKDTAVPEYILVVDKRVNFKPYEPDKDPPAQESSVMLAAKIPAVEVLDAEATKDAKIRKIVPGFKVRFTASGGEAVLLRAAPDLEKLLGGKDALALYTQINTALAAAMQKPDEIAKAVAAAKADAAKLRGLMKDVDAAQAADTLKRLDAAIDAAK
ncbi:MAG: hypothetical protein ABFD92_12140 [Planctomycetaceae bacterium]|nr:hypothetical protein [Planctomycetaceae bacterium]